MPSLFLSRTTSSRKSSSPGRDAFAEIRRSIARTLHGPDRVHHESHSNHDGDPAPQRHHLPGLSNGWPTLKDGSVRTGFATEMTAEKIVLRDLTDAVFTVAAADVKEEQHPPNPMMPEGLANALFLDEFAALVQFLASGK